MRRLPVLLALLLASAFAPAQAANPATHVVVVVWDGMRPDFVTPELTPVLWKLQQEGVQFAHHHPVYISTTEVNGTAIATGTYPGVSTVVANVEYRPAINAREPVATEAFETIRQGDALSDGHFLGAPTVAEILHAHGMKTAIAGTKGVALLHDRSPRAEGAPGAILFEGKTLPESLAAQIVTHQGSLPGWGPTKTNLDWWTANALIDQLWKDTVPPFSVLWLAEPDLSQHLTGPGSPQSLSVIRNNDAILGRLLGALEQKHVRDQTDILIVSDHGFSTVTQRLDLAGLLNTNGFHAFRAFPDAGPKEGDILVVGGASALFYVAGHEKTVIEKLAHFLQTQPFSGVMLTRKGLKGTFPLSLLKIDSPTAPDLVLSLRWTDAPSVTGAPGTVSIDMGAGKGVIGTHGSLSPRDMHNLGVAAGPDFRRGFVDPLPSGNVDIAPTVLWLLGVKSPTALSGRVLAEALNGAGTVPAARTRRVESTWKGPALVWKQYLKYSEVNGTRYFDEGNRTQP